MAFLASQEGDKLVPELTNVKPTIAHNQIIEGDDWEVYFSPLWNTILFRIRQTNSVWVFETGRDLVECALWAQTDDRVAQAVEDYGLFNPVKS